MDATARKVLCAGILTGVIGSKNQVTGAQETAKNFISESLSIFESLNYTNEATEARAELALCYWRTGEYNEARDILKETLSRLVADSELKARVLIRCALVERGAARYTDSLRILIDNAPLFGKVKNNIVKGSYHSTLANVLENLWEIERQQEYVDRAFVEYAAASYHFEQAGHQCYRANVENNLGFLHFKAGRYKEAHEHLNRARRIVIYLKDSGTLAQYDKTRTRVFLAEGNNAEAEKAARASIMILEQGGQSGLLAEALITHGTALARLRYYSQSYATLQHAIEVARESGSLSRAGEAALILIDELGEHLAPRGVTSNLTGCSIKDIRRYEHDLIKDALLRAEGSITHAAHLLGTSHQRVSYIIESRHRDLLKVRKPKKQRPRRK